MSHCTALGWYRLDERVIEFNSYFNEIPILWAQDLITEFYRVSEGILRSDAWMKESAVYSRGDKSCDIADFIDGRILVAILVLHATDIEIPFSSCNWVGEIAQLLKDNLATVCSWAATMKKKWKVQMHRFSCEENRNSISKLDQNEVEPQCSSIGVLPFSHPVFDPHLAPVQVTVVAENTPISESAQSIFEEITHWHNHRKLIDPKIPTPECKFWQRKNQIRMAEMQRYAASLTSASAGILEPEVIIEGKPYATRSHIQDVSNGKRRRKNVSMKDEEKLQGKKKQSSGRAAALNAASMIKKKKESQRIDASVNAWKEKHNHANAKFVNDPLLAYRQADKYLSSLPYEKLRDIKADIVCYEIQALGEYWMRLRIREKDMSPSHESYHIAARVWYLVNILGSLPDGVSDDICTRVLSIVSALGLPSVNIVVDTNRTRPLAVSYPGLHRVDDIDTSLRISISRYELQLVYLGPYLDRSVDSAPDERVRGFLPDRWQRSVLDEIDKGNSLLIVAPTSAGKTFISFYAMRQVLVADSLGILVYVAPTKALVNQIAAEIQARFSKQFKHGGKSVWAIHTRDYRINSPTGCQILVTVPHILQIMLMSPLHANSWSRRVKRIIFDEVHCIGQKEDGVIWEQLLLMSPCPIIALSATIGNPKTFGEWLNITRKNRKEFEVSKEAGKEELTLIEHSQRYSDLRKFLYVPPKKFLFRGLKNRSSNEPPYDSLDDNEAFAFIHPYSSLSSSASSIPPDLALEPRDCWMLWQSMKKHQTPKFPVADHIDPENCLPETIRKVDVKNWQFKLNKVLQNWMRDPASPFDKVIEDLSRSVRDINEHRELQVTGDRICSQQTSEDFETAMPISGKGLKETTLPLICSLQESCGLPAIFFHYDRFGCEEIAASVLNKLKEAEQVYKEGSTQWAKQMARWTLWKGKKKDQENNLKKMSEKKIKMKKILEEKNKFAALDSEDDAVWSVFDPDDPIEGFHLAAETMSSSRDMFEQYKKQLRQHGIAEWLIESLRRGIGVHHAGMSRKYRLVCEMLFRSGYLRVVIATGTLALGINMPCKTVVFAGDSIYLSALNFRQCAGRAGRRGFDVLGNVIFQEMSLPRISRLLTSRLPELRGHFPLTTSLVLRMFTLLHGSRNTDFARQLVSSMLSTPRICIDGAKESRNTVLHHARFSIEYLRRNCLLSEKGASVNFASIIGHLYYQENNAFAFHALLREGYFHRLATKIVHSSGSEREELLKLLMLVLAHIFNRKKLSSAHLECWLNMKANSSGSNSSSVVLLPDLPLEANDILKAHNDQTKNMFFNYVSTFVEQHLQYITDDLLPLSGIQCGGSNKTIKSLSHQNSSRNTKITSAFVALSGHSDRWASISDLCRTVRSGVWLEDSVIPQAPVSNGDILNACKLKKTNIKSSEFYG